MPPKKKSSLSQASRESKRKKKSRFQESEEDHEDRLRSQRIRALNFRAMEFLEDRLMADRERHSLSRAKEDSSQRETRLMTVRKRQAQVRETETFRERENRLTADQWRHTMSRATETANERQNRLTADQQRHIVLRATETVNERQNRLTADHQRHTVLRASETVDERQIRLTADQQRHSLLRATETVNERQNRLTADQHRHTESRATETQSERETRIIADRQRHAEFRFLKSSLSQTSGDSQENVVLNVNLPWINKANSGFAYNHTINYAEFSSIGGMSVRCDKCQAVKWKKESDGFCCAGGKICLDGFQDPPEPLKSLLNGEHPESKHFLDNIRTFNSAFQMTSFGANKITEGSFMPTFKIQGQVYHLIGSLLPEAEQPKFLQIYFVSNYNEQVSARNQLFPTLSVNLITVLQNMLHEVNPYVRDFKAALESIPQTQNNEYKVVISADRRPSAEHRGCYNTPTANEVAVVLVDEECNRRDIVLKTKDNRLQRINETHVAYDALQYPLIYCRGEDGYNFAVRQVDPATGAPKLNKKVSALQFYCYHLQLRSNTFVYLQRYRGLFSQFIVDMYAKIETERLVYIRNNQRQLRAEDYVHLRDAMQQDNSAENLGRLVILPSTFTGGPRCMHERTQDAFCYVRKYGRPDLFITFTTNPKWEEIMHELLPGQTCYDRHDIIARVFHLKLKLMTDLLTKENVFGEAQCYMYSVEWQKRGLPHAHILLWLVHKVRPNDIDKLISAEFPDPLEDTTLHDIVKTHMIHGPCGALNRNSPCMKDANCTKRYPRALLDQTITGEDGYPLYRRRSPPQGGFTAKIKMRGQEVVLDNKWVVPYSPVLSNTFKAHINVEMCNSVQSIKYICKYVNKGSDQAMFALRNNERDEVTRYQSGRYISSSEAVWRIFSFSIHERYPPVTHLDVHVEGGQRIYFNAENLAARLENPRQTTLLAFFHLCEVDDFAKTLLYDEVPSYYTYDKQRGIFNRRKRGASVEGVTGIFKEHVIGRVFNVHPNNSECYYLRLLLHTVKGPTSFSELRTVDGIEYPTYQAACRARHMIDDDSHWDDALAEACVSDSPHRLRHLFGIMLVFCALSDPLQLWQKYQDKLSEDFLKDMLLYNVSRENVLNRSLIAIQKTVIAMGGNPLTRYGFVMPTLTEESVNSKYVSEINYNRVELAENLQNCVPNLTVEQRTVFDRVCHSVNNNLGEMLFLDAPGGTGKTFVTKDDLCQKVSSLQDLISFVYNNPSEITNRDNSWLCERAILTPRNDQALAINRHISAQVDGENKVYSSINSVLEPDDATNFPVEFLNSLSAPGLPSHKISLKVGVPIILLRNLNPPKLCNGTRLRVTSLQQNIIEAEVLTGCGVGDRVYIPRIPLIPSNFPFRFKRVQFPVSVCFAMTINKAQGQTLHIAGVDLSVSCFSHGQLYVAFSRVSNPENLCVYAPDNVTSNIVYKEAL